jgi:hypothetical protein
MTRILVLAALLAAGALASPEPALAAKGGFKAMHAMAMRPAPFRANGLFGPITPRTLSHTGLPAKVHGHHHHAVVPRIVSIRPGGSILAYSLPYGATPEADAVNPAVVPVGGSVGCVTEDVAVAVDRTVSIIRC